MKSASLVNERKKYRTKQNKRKLDFQMFGCWWIVTSNAFVLGWIIFQIWRIAKLTFRNPCRWIVTSDAFVLSWMTLRNLRNSKKMFPPAAGLD